MRKYTFFAFLLFVASSLSAQLVNDGGMIVIESGATLVVEGNIDNGSGTITNNGTIKVQDDFTNSATLTSAVGSQIIFTGDMPSNFTTGGAELAIVRNEKTANDVVLIDNMQVAESVDFFGTSNIVLGTNSVILADGAMTNGDAAKGWFVTDDIGTVTRYTDATGTATFDVGDLNNFSPLSIVHSGTYTPGVSQISAKATNVTHPNLLADADSYISRYWSVNATDITGFSGEMEGTFVPGDVNGTGDIVGARYEGTEWEFATGAATASTVTATSGSNMSDLTGKNFYGKADLKVFLDGPYNNATQMMSTALNSGGNLPLVSPYGDGATVAAGFFSLAGNEDIVDWIYLETRDAAGAISGGSAAFLESDGDVVALDGVSTPLIKDALTNNYIVIDHRNHSAIATGSAIALDGTAALQDFSSSAYSAFGSNGRKLYAGTSRAAMWSGDAADNDNIRLLGASNDSDVIRNNVLGDPANFFNFLTFSINNVYDPSDVNMDGSIKFLGANNDNDVIRNSILAHPGNFFNFLTYTINSTIPQ